MDMLYVLIIGYAGKMVLALLVLFIGLKVIKRITQFVSDRLHKSGLDDSLKSFLLPLVRVTLQVLLVITIASMLGAEMTSFVAIIGAAGFAIGLALQGSLANFAGGVLILMLKPFKVGDYIEAAGFAGTVKDIQVFYTVLNTPDNRKIIIPNANLSNNSAINYSAYETRRLDLKFGVGYGDDISKVKQVLQRLAEDHKLVLQNPAPVIVLGEHGDHAVIFYFRVWCAASDYWPLYFEFMEKVKVAFDEEGINIPYPQFDVHMIKQS